MWDREGEKRRRAAISLNGGPFAPLKHKMNAEGL